MSFQIVNNTDEKVPCANCGQNLAELGNFTYTGTTTNLATQKDEECKCKKCGQHFILRYHYFDEEGHINSFVFNGDINDPTYNWQDQLILEQKKAIGAHLKTCDSCMKRMTEEALSDAWLASLIHNGNTRI
jgi:DNA-directed RNA polymerase subunit RPC12/RpoP